MWGRDHLAQAFSVRDACALPLAGCAVRSCQRNNVRVRLRSGATVK